MGAAQHVGPGREIAAPRNEPKLLLSIGEAAARVGLHRTTIYKLLARGTLPSVKVGTRRLIRPDDLEAWVNSLPSAGASPPPTPPPPRTTTARTTAGKGRIHG